MDVEDEALHVAARLGPYCGRRNRGSLLRPEIVSMYFFQSHALGGKRATHIPPQTIRRL
jgi:hypothetical protein